ncbi:FCD domain-containing protein [Pseudooceanicola algae]|uniref:HTH-type transcriptional repressor GlaR n=1 Tax=Pseudooceanicola algae TaxID=1537215 RepID=A0A418SHZ9_9RHOB|nr:FCD domain-containing protein [Pseudooceanicola algae]QPM90254.1 HTH-type transcriptional repressor GlaR [Pseudooceanicola algae]
MNTSPPATPRNGDRPAARTIAETTYGALKEDVLTGVMLPGQSLLTRELTERYGCGISPLREALARLVAEGLLEAVRHRGVRVPLPTVEDLNDIYRIRIALEREALMLAMAHGDDHWEGQILSAAHRLAHAPLPDSPASGPALRDWEARHRAFHSSLIAAAPAPRLLRLIGQMVDQTERYRALRLTQFTADNIAGFVAEHDALRDAVIARDPAAPEMLAEHFESSRRFVEAYLRDRPSGK